MENSVIETIDNYLQGKLSAEAAVAFEQEMTQDAVLKKAVAEQQELIAGMEAYEEKKKFLEMMQSIKEEKAPARNLSVVKEEAEPSKEKKANVFTLRRVLAMAASVALLVAALVFLVQPTTDVSLLAQQNFEVYPDQLTARLEASGAVSGNETLVPILQEAMTAYKNGDLTNAKQNLESFKEKTSKRDYLTILTDFYLAQIALSEQQYEKSISLLSPLAKESGLPIEAAVNWYLALAHIGQSEKATALTLLKKIPATDAFATKAQNLIEQLE